MKQVNFSHAGGFPLEQETLERLQTAYRSELYEALKWDIVDAYFKNKNYHYNDVFLEYNKSNTAKFQAIDKKMRDSTLLNLKPQLSANKYTGKYVNDLYGSLEITRGETGNDLEIRFEHHPKMYAKLQPLGGNRFYVTFSDPVFGKAIFPFTVKDGKVTNLRVKVADFVEYNPYDFRKVE